MKTEFIPYEQALALKELGFDEECFGRYLTEEAWKLDLTPKSFKIKECQNSKCSEFDLSAPTFSQVFRWFREKYNISYSIDWMSRSSEFYNGYYVHFRGINDNKINQENFIVLNDELPSKGYKVYKTYEEAELACLKKLIEIVNK
jgi:hypothetical protein